MRSIVVVPLLLLGAWSTPALAQARYDVGLLLGSTNASNEGSAPRLRWLRSAILSHG
jgi:hypothetical protein